MDRSSRFALAGMLATILLSVVPESRAVDTVAVPIASVQIVGAAVVSVAPPGCSFNSFDPRPIVSPGSPVQLDLGCAVITYSINGNTLTMDTSRPSAFISQQINVAFQAPVGESPAAVIVRGDLSLNGCLRIQGETGGSYPRSNEGPFTLTAIPGDRIVMECISFGAAKATEPLLTLLTIAPPAALSPACQADVTRDGVVNFADVAKVKGAFFQRCAP